MLERNSNIGGAAVSEEIVKGFTFSRASYLAGLLRPSIIKDLELEKVRGAVGLASPCHSRGGFLL